MGRNGSGVRDRSGKDGCRNMAHRAGRRVCLIKVQMLKIVAGRIRRMEVPRFRVGNGVSLTSRWHRSDGEPLTLANASQELASLIFEVLTDRTLFNRLATNCLPRLA